MTPRVRRLLAVTLPLAVACALASCSKEPTRPVRAPVNRTVTVVLHDSLGAPLANAPAMLTSGVDADGMVEVVTGTTDAGGALVKVLPEGGWTAAAHSGSLAAGAWFTVAGPERAESDTQLVNLVAHTGSRLSGTCTLAGRTDHSGIFVTSLFSAGFAVTDVNGAWSLEGAPLGHWTVTMETFGFQSGVASVNVTTPGSAVAVPAVRLLSAP